MGGGEGGQVTGLLRRQLQRTDNRRKQMAVARILGGGRRIEEPLKWAFGWPWAEVRMDIRPLLFERFLSPLPKADQFPRQHTNRRLLKWSVGFFVGLGRRSGGSSDLQAFTQTVPYPPPPQDRPILPDHFETLQSISRFQILGGQLQINTEVRGGLASHCGRDPE